MPKTIVVKVGTSTLADAEGRIDRGFLNSLADQFCALADEGRRMVLVSSGAVRAGAEILGISLVTNLAAGMTGEPLNHEEVLQAGRDSATRMGSLLAQVLDRL